MMRESRLDDEFDRFDSGVRTENLWVYRITSDLVL
jgi:hypothetical protein